MGIKISYGITICNELEEIKHLVPFLHENIRQEDEIVVLLDKPKASQELIDQLHRYSSSNWIILKESEFKNHFADWKNELTSLCSGDYIFQIDADEYPHKELIQYLPEILKDNPTVEVLVVPRVNTVENITQEHIQKWRWHINENGWINYPDYQWRVYKNSPNIKWKNKVHEIIDGHKVVGQIPALESLSLYHPKTIERQEKQNNYYNTL